LSFGVEAIAVTLVVRRKNPELVLTTLDPLAADLRGRRPRAELRARGPNDSSCAWELFTSEGTRNPNPKIAKAARTRNRVVSSLLGERLEFLSDE